MNPVPVAQVPDLTIAHEAFSILDLIEHAHVTAATHGFWEGQIAMDVLPEKIALMHSELSEALEAWRKREPLYFIDPAHDSGKPEGVLVELADCMIRIADYVGAMEAGPLFLEALTAKLNYNSTRPYKHGKRA